MNGPMQTCDPILLDDSNDAIALVRALEQAEKNSQRRRSDDVA